MIHPIKKFRSCIEAIKRAFRLLITTVESLRASVEENTIEQKELRSKLDTLVEHSAFLASAKKRELQRAGHHS